MVNQLLHYLTSLNDCNPSQSISTHYNQGATTYHPKASSTPLSPKATSQPGTNLTMPQHTTCFHKEGQPQVTSTSNPSSSGTLTLSSPDDADAPCSTHSTLSTRHLCSRLPITYNETALMKLHGRPLIQMLNSFSLPFPLNDSDQESPLTSNSGYTEEELPAGLQPKEEESPMTKLSCANHKGVTNDQAIKHRHQGIVNNNPKHR